jgi:transposase InsO family protein
MTRRLPSASGSPRPSIAPRSTGYVHVDVCELRSAEGKLHLFLAIDRVTKFAYVELHERATTMTGGAFMRGVVEAFPCKIRKVLTDNGVPFTPTAGTNKWDWKVVPFDRVCREHGIVHKLTRPYHPWTNGQAERMNRTVKEATVKAFHYETAEGLTAHVLSFVRAYNFAIALRA